MIFHCSKLTKIDIHDEVKEIDDRAFDGCQSLEKITIPSSVTSIEQNAFSYCYSLRTIFYKGLNEPETCVTKAIPETTKIFVPNDYNDNIFCELSIYKITGTCGNECYWYVSSDETSLLIYGIGTMTDFERYESVDGGV